jgi:hypothetical protein
MEYWTAEGIIRGLTRSDDCPPCEIFDNMFLLVEKQARELLTERGYGIDPSYLTPNDDQQNRNTWLNEAFQLLDYDLDFELEQAAILLIESSKLQSFLSENKADQAALSASKIIAITLLPNDTELTAITKDYKSRPSKGGQSSKRSKGILIACAKIRKENPNITAKDCWDKLFDIANDPDGDEIADNGGNYFTLEIETYYPKSKDPELDDRIESHRIISTNENTGKKDGRPVTLKTLYNWFTEDNKSNIFKDYS